MARFEGNLSQNTPVLELSDISTPLLSGLHYLHEAFTSLKYTHVHSYTATTAHFGSPFGDGIAYGSGFPTGVASINKIKFGSSMYEDMDAEFIGKVTANSNGVTSGTYTRASLDAPEFSVDAIGHIPANLKSLDFSSVHYTQEGFEVTFTGAMRFTMDPSGADVFSGAITGIEYSDDDGNTALIKGASLGVADIDLEDGNLFDLILRLMSGDDKVDGSKAADNLHTFGGNDTLTGGLGTDTLAGGEGDDTYVQNLASLDVVEEEEDGGSDTYLITSNNAAATVVTLDIADYSNIENITLKGKGLYNLIGDDLDNHLIGNASANLLIGDTGNDILVGGGGKDTLDGGEGNDTYVIDSLNDVYAEATDAGNDTIDIGYKNTSKAVTLQLDSFANFENLSVSGSGLYNLTGNATNNHLKGNASANLINGNGGEDTMDGGGGNDSYIVDSAGDVTTESLVGKAGGQDVVNASVSHTLGDNIEKLVLNGSDDINGTGNAINNLIQGNSGNNVLNGKAGADTLQGGDGDDTYYIDDVKDMIVDIGQGTTIYSSSLNYTLGKNFSSLTLIGNDNINATGNDSNNTLTGNSGNNILNGGKGLDTLIGGAGNDTYILDFNAMDVVQEDADGGSDVYQFSFSNTSSTAVVLNVADYANIEGLTVTGKGLFNLIGNDNDSRLTGNASKNLLQGGAGDDTLKGGGGVDTMVGGLGDDTYYTDTIKDVFTEEADSGNDTLVIEYSNTTKLYRHIVLADESWLPVFTGYKNFENVIINGSGKFEVIGNSENNYIKGNGNSSRLTGYSGDDTLDGGGGLAFLEGGDGNDTYIIRSDKQDIIWQVHDTGGTDTIVIAYDNENLVPVKIETNPLVLVESVENWIITGHGLFNLLGDGRPNLLVGNDSANLINGYNYHDTLIGGGGDDTLVGNYEDLLTGGEGNDVFQFSTSPYQQPSLITDFMTGEDRINLKDFNVLSGGILDTSDFVSGAGAVALDSSDHIIFDSDDGSIYYDTDGSGAMAMVKFAILQTGTISADDFLIG